MPNILSTSALKCKTKALEGRAKSAIAWALPSYNEQEVLADFIDCDVWVERRPEGGYGGRSLKGLCHQFRSS
jgi:hypothetical protein